MLISIMCPTCHARFSLAESAGCQAVQCPKCFNAFTAVAQEAIAPSGAALGYQKEAPRHYFPGSGVGRSANKPDLDIRRTDALGSWRKTKAGLILILICTSIALPIWGLCGLIAVRDDTGWAGGFAIAALLVLTHPILALAAFIGVCLCWTAPYPPAHYRAGTSALIVIGSVVVLMPVILLAASPNCPPDQIMMLLFGLPILVVIGAIVYWYLFHVAVADCFQDPSLRKFSLLTIILTPAIPLIVVIADIAVPLIFTVGGPGERWGRAFFFFLVCIIIGMNSALCIKTIRTIKRGTATTC
jgi:hypothetical protein